MDQAYLNRVLQCLGDGAFDRAVVFAHDWPHDPQGRPLRLQAPFHTPNDAVLDLADRCPVVFPAVSIHPARPDALEELDRCLARGARFLKLLPNVHGVNPMDPGFRPFFLRMAQSGMVLIAHTGGEHALPVLDRRLQDPRCLEGPLQCGVTVVAAHCGIAGLPFDRGYFEHWQRLCLRYPRLFGDTAAMASPFRAYGLKRLLRSPFRDRVIHGSDFPIPSGPSGVFLRGMMPCSRFWRCLRERNPLQRDWMVKEACGLVSRASAARVLARLGVSA